MIPRNIPKVNVKIWGGHLWYSDRWKLLFHLFFQYLSIWFNRNDVDASWRAEIWDFDQRCHMFYFGTVSFLSQASTFYRWGDTLSQSSHRGTKSLGALEPRVSRWYDHFAGRGGRPILDGGYEPGTHGAKLLDKNDKGVLVLGFWRYWVPSHSDKPR